MNNILECKICGGNIIPNSDAITGKCESCGATTVIPKETTNSSKINRANYLRRANDFEKGIELFEEIIKENSGDSEAYWGLVLCKFGIEYVDDVDGSKKPTCHRTISESILNDPDYKAALDNSVGAVHYLYEEEALRIDEIQKKIKAIAANEQPYDIFICYKESDELGQRTHDSVDVQEIYNRLSNKGYKVFFARKTLQNKLGSEYEPIIYAALSSAKVMLVYGSEPDYFNAVWVKNEWSRFRRMMKSEPNKKIIPVFDGSKMSAYDLPNELADFQAFDKYRVGFIEDLVDGIQKIISYSYSNNKKSEKMEYSQGSDSSSNGLTERAYMFLSEGAPEKANEYFERVLDINPRDVNAYIGKLMIEYEIGEIGEFEILETAEPLETSDNYAKILKYGDEKTKQQFTYYNNCGIYNQAEYILNSATSSELIDTAFRLFESIPDFKDAREKVKVDKGKYLQYNSCIFRMNNYSENEYMIEELKNTFETFGDFRDSVNLAEEFRHKLFELRYKDAVRLLNDAKKCLKEGPYDVNKIKNIKGLFSSIIEYKDCRQMEEVCDNLILEARYVELVRRKDNYINDFNTTEEEYFNLADSFLELGDYKDAQSLAQVCRDMPKEVEKRKRNLRKMQVKKAVTVLLTLVVLAVLSAVIIGFFIELKKTKNYENALSLLHSNEYESALKIFKMLGSYEDSKEKLSVCKENIYRKGVELYNQEDYWGAAEEFSLIINYKDSRDYIDSCESYNYASVALGSAGEWVQIQEYSENNNEADNNHKTSMDIYTPIIKQCKSSIGKFEEDVSDIVSYMSSPNEIGYCLRDIDNNGVDELLIVDLRDRKTIIYAYTIVNDTPVEIIYSIERSPYFLSKNNVIINETSSSADEFTINYYNLGSDGKTLELIETLVDYTAHYPEERYYLCSTTQSYYNDYDYSNADEFYIISENDFLNTRNSYAKDYLECTALSDI